MLITHHRFAHPETWRSLAIKRADLHFNLIPTPLRRQQDAISIFQGKMDAVNSSPPHKRMKLTGLILLGTLGSVTLTVDGQVAAPPSVDLYSGQKQPETTATPSPEPNGPDLPDVSKLDETFKQPTSLGKQGDERRVHIEWRQLKNRVVNDPEVRAAKATAQAARTDLEKRNLLREYYKVYYERMSALASTAEMKLALEALKTGHEDPLNQPHVRPSPTPEGSSPTPTPTPPRKQKKKHKK